MGLLVLGAVLVLVETRGLSFFADEWDFVLQRRGLSAGVLLRPHGPHLSLVPILIFKLLLSVFAGGSYLPFRLLAAFDLALVAFVLGIACRDRWGRWWGLAPVLLMVTLGPGAVTILWPFQVGYSVAVVAGLVALIALDRDSPRGGVVTCVALVVSLASASQGIGFVAGAAVMLLIRGDWRRRAWVVLVPAILYLLWYAKYGQQHSETHLSLIHTSLSWSMQALSATAAATVGLTSVSPQTGLADATFGVPLAVATLAAVAAAAWRGWRPRPIFWGSAAALVVVWVAASLSQSATISRAPNDPRYLSSDVALLLLCLCAGVVRPRVTRAAVAVTCVVLAIVAATNAGQYGRQYTSYSNADATSRAELGALLILRGVVSPTFSPAAAGDVNLVNVQAQQFFSAVDAYGLREDSPAEIATASPSIREAADKVLETGEITLVRTATAPGAFTTPTVLGGTARVAGKCLVVGSALLVVRASAGAFRLTPGPTDMMTAALGRFAPSFGIPIAKLPAGTTPALVNFPADGAPGMPWRMMVTGPGGRICYVSHPS